MIKTNNPVIPVSTGLQKLSTKQVEQLTEIYCQLSGVSLSDVKTALKTVKISLLVRSGNTKYPVPAEHIFVFDKENPKESAKFNGEVCSVGVTLTSDLDPSRTFKCGLKDAINFAILLP